VSRYTIPCVTTQKSTVLIFFSVEALDSRKQLNVSDLGAGEAGEAGEDGAF
jgi:hypothetical protein